MTVVKLRPALAEIKSLLSADKDFLKPLVRAVLQEVLEAEMTEALGAAKGERVEARLGYRSGHYTRSLVTRIGKIELRVPQDRQGRFSTELFERYQRSEKALMAALTEMYIQGVSTRKVKAITEELIGHSFSASCVSAVVKKLDAELARFAHRRLNEPFAYLVLDARYEKVLIDSVIQSQAVLIAVGIDWEGRRQVLSVELANRESRSSWREFLMGNMKSTNMLEHFIEEIRRRTRVVRIFPNEASCLRLVRALAVEQHERWQEDHRYLNMAFLKEAQRERLKTAA